MKVILEDTIKLKPEVLPKIEQINEQDIAKENISKNMTNN